MILELDHVSKRYPTSSETVHAVRDVSMSIDAREIVVLYGPSGSGKSTLLLLAAGVLSPEAGTIRSHGRDIASLSKRQVADRLRDDVGIAYQDPGLLAGHTVLDNVATKLISGSASLREARRLAMPWLTRTGLSDRLEHRPHELSGGERQRVGIARALIGDPSLLLLDEPTAGLDSKRGTEILDLVAGAALLGTAVLLATHDPAVVRIATRIVEIHDGQLVGQSREWAA